MISPARGRVPVDFEPIESRTVVAPVPAGTIVPIAGAVDESGAGPMLSCATAESVKALGETVESPVPGAPSWPFGAQATSAAAAINSVIGRNIGIRSKMGQWSARERGRRQSYPEKYRRIGQRPQDLDHRSEADDRPRTEEPTRIDPQGRRLGTRDEVLVVPTLHRRRRLGEQSRLAIELGDHHARRRRPRIGGETAPAREHLPEDRRGDRAARGPRRDRPWPVEAEPDARDDLRRDVRLLASLTLASDLRTLQATLEDALQRAVARNTLLRMEIDTDVEQGSKRVVATEDWYFINTVKGRQTLALVRQGKLHELQAVIPEEARLRVERPNIFTLYEQNIGMMTPLIADQLRDMEKSYTPEWVDEAFGIAVSRNKRNLRYVQAILKRWEIEGKDNESNEETGRDSEAQRRRKYLPDEYSDVVLG